MDEFPSNSRRPTTPGPLNNSTPASNEPPKLEAVTHNAVLRKKPLGRRVMDTFFRGDSSSVFGYLIKDVLVPALQDMATDIVKQGIERAVYGEVRSTGRTMNRPGVQRTHVSYNSVSSPITQPAPARAMVSQPSALDVSDIVVADANTAIIIRERLNETIEQFGQVSVANLYELVGRTATVTDYKYGWIDLSDMGYQRIRDGYLLILPRPEDIR